jgi:hypothetical protein
MCARVSHRSRILNVHFCDMSSCVDLKRVEGTFVSPLVICNTAFAVASPAAIAAATTTTITSPKGMAVPSTNILSKETISYISCCRQERLSCYICVCIPTPEDVKDLLLLLTAHGLSLKQALARIDGDGLFLSEGGFIYF